MVISNWSNNLHVLGVVLAFGVGTIFVPAPVLGQSNSNLSRDDAQRTLRTKKQDLETTLRREKKLKGDVVYLKKERSRLKQQLIETAKRVRRGEERLTEFEEELRALNVKEQKARASLSTQHRTITKLLAAMQRMGRNPPPVVVTRREDALAMVRSAMMLASVFPELKGKALALSSQLNELVEIMTATRTRRDELRAENKRIADSRLKLETLVTERRNTITLHQSEIVELQRTAARLARTVTNLDQLVAKLDEEVSKKSKLGEYEREIAALKPSIDPDPPQTTEVKPAVKPEVEPLAKTPGKSDRIAGKAPTPKKPAVELKPSNNRYALLRPGRLKPEIRFGRAKGTLLMPASGRKIIDYGQKNSFGRKSEGISIETRASAQITSPSDGWVVFAGPFRLYGQLLIINGGNGYHVLLAGLSQIDVSLGQFVIKGEPVGVMGKTTKSDQLGGGQDENPVLYVEFRKKGRPINPKPWWSRKSKKVQG